MLSLRLGALGRQAAVWLPMLWAGLLRKLFGKTEALVHTVSSHWLLGSFTLSWHPGAARGSLPSNAGARLLGKLLGNLVGNTGA